MMKQNPPSRNPPILPVITIISILYFIYYLWWRAAYSLNPQQPFLSWLLWASEAFGVLAFILFSYFVRNIDSLKPDTVPAHGMSVDIFIPTYNEEEDILEATVIGCKTITYPHITYLLDDGNRPWVKELAGKYGCRYIARPTHEHAKAGNINYALTKTKGDFIAILDADMVPQPDYLDRTLGYFADEKLALIQLPQEFYNRDSIQHAKNKPSWHEQALFFRIIQPGKNYTNSAFWCGSPSVVRRKALVDVGGVATETITEDIHTTVRLHSRGWNTLYINEPLAFGIAPQTIKAFLLQRLRWAQGTMQLYRSKESPLWRKGLTLNQRVSYLSSFFAYLEAFQKFILISIPILILGFKVLPITADVVSFAIHWVPYFTLNILANVYAGRGNFDYFKTEKYNLLKTIIFMQSAFTLISRKQLKFKVTPKSIDNSVYGQERKAMLWYMVIFGSLIGAMIHAVIAIFLPVRGNFHVDAFVIAFFWAFYNAGVIAMALGEVFRKRHERKGYRFPVNVDGELEVAYGARTEDAPVVGRKIGSWPGNLEIFKNPSEKRRHSRYPVNEQINIMAEGQADLVISARIVDLSLGGAGLLIDSPIPEGIKIAYLKILPDQQKVITLPVEHLAYEKKQEQGGYLLGCQFSEDAGAQREDLMKFLFITLPKREQFRFI